MLLLSAGARAQPLLQQLPIQRRREALQRI
jgi:hypothetical protein